MSITAERKSEVIKEYAKGANDTGSPEVQIAILSDSRATCTSGDPVSSFLRWYS